MCQPRLAWNSERNRHRWLERLRTSILPSRRYLICVMNDKFYKGPSPQGSSAREWINQATLIGNVGRRCFQFLFFDPDGILYGVYKSKFYKGLPPGFPGTDPKWLGIASLVGSDGWSIFKFLFFDPIGTLYGVIKGNLYRRSPPTDPANCWLVTPSQIGTGGWEDFQFFFFMPDNDLYVVRQDKFLKRSPPTYGSSDDWMGSAETIGSVGWSMFKFLVSPVPGRH